MIHGKAVTPYWRTAQPLGDATQHVTAGSTKRTCSEMVGEPPTMPKHGCAWVLPARSMNAIVVSRCTALAGYVAVGGGGCFHQRAVADAHAVMHLVPG